VSFEPVHQQRRLILSQAFKKKEKKYKMELLEE